MKKLITILFLVFGFSSIAYAESSLPKCQGDDYKQWTNCYGEIKFPRNEYKGEWKDGKFEGKGTLTEPWGVYVGDFKNNLAHGVGRQTFNDGGWFEGEIKNDELNGKAIHVWANGDKYIGTFVNSIMQGPAIVEYVDGARYEGNFKDDLYHGQGKLEYADGESYDGNWKEGYYYG